MSAESAGPVSAPTLPVGGPPSSGSHGVLGSAGPSLVGVSALGTPAVKQTHLSMYTGGQMSTSLATGIVAAEVHAELEQSSSATPSLRQPPTVNAATETAAAEGLTRVTKFERTFWERG